jgi:hypothetical protein
MALVLSFRPMPEINPPNDTPQFATAEYAGAPGTERCEFCTQTIASHYYRVNGRTTCSSCAERAARERPQDNHAAYMRALLLGVGAAVAGLILYAAVSIITGLMIGFVSLAVGYIVGHAMMKGSGGIGGRRYQITAVLLTYAAVSMAAVPVAISQFAKQKKTQQQQLQMEQEQFEKEFGQQRQLPPTKPQQPKISAGAAFAGLAVLGLASPFLEMQDPLHGLIGLVILYVGMQIAWKTTAGRKVEILGPFDNSAPAS